MQQEIRKYGTERCEQLLKLCGNPDKKLKIVHISGTNGKGSTAGFISSSLYAAGKRVGTFTSPQVFCYEEQFRINLTPLSKAVIDSYLNEVKRLSQCMSDFPSPFEIETAAAILAFYKEGCEYAVIECGLGGRDDATNAIAQKQVAVFTSISLEHTAELGATVIDICRAKSGIIKDCPVVVSDYQSKEVKDFFRRFDPIFAGEGLEKEKDSSNGQTFTYKGNRYKINMLGRAQLYNAATAIEVCNLLGIGQSYIAQGLKNTVLGGRLQVEESGGVKYILDGAHNPGAIAELVEVLENIKGEKELVFGCLSDKDVESAARLLAPCFKRVILFSPPSVRAMALEKIVGAFSNKLDYITADGVSDALKKTQSKTVVVCGSFTFIKEAQEWIKKRQ